VRQASAIMSDENATIRVIFPDAERTQLTIVAHKRT
jgi:hypothetical protein